MIPLTRACRSRWAELKADEAEVDRLCARWARVCEGAGLCHRIDTVSGPTIVTPQIVDVTLGPPRRLVVRLLPGMLSGDVTAVARRLAEGMAAAAVRIEQTHHNYVSVRLLERDPLAIEVERVLPSSAVAEDPPTLGVSEIGHPVPLDLARAAHVVVQGSSGAGKSVAGYSLLGQLVEAKDVRVTGSDPSGLLLRPWVGRFDDVPQPALGTTDPTEHVAVFEDLVALMDVRIGTLPAGRDEVQISANDPLVLAALEEFAGLVRMLEAHDPKLAKKGRGLIGRLFAEGRKAGIRLLVMLQRADANLLGGYERGQASHRISFRVDSLEALRMLHADASAETVLDHSTARSGVGLLTAPGVPLLRFRSPYVPYSDYCAVVEGA